MCQISVIVPVYKTEAYLRRCIDSLLAQTFTDFEALLVDDGSPDGCGEICDDYADKDQRIRVFHKKNGGQSSARNHALERARGRYVFFLDSDDELPPHALSTCFQEAVKHDTDILAYQFGFIDKDSRPIAGFKNDYTADVLYRGADFLNRFTIVGAMCMYFYKRNFLSENKLKLLEGIYREDEDFVVKAIALADKVLYTDSILYFYRKNPSSTTQLKSEERKIQLLFSTLQVLESLSEFMALRLPHSEARHGIRKKMESLAVSFFLEFISIRKQMTARQRKEALNRIKAVRLLPLRIKENGLKYRLFSFFLNLYMKF